MRVEWIICVSMSTCFRSTVYRAAWQATLLRKASCHRQSADRVARHHYAQARQSGEDAAFDERDQCGRVYCAPCERRSYHPIGHHLLGEGLWRYRVNENRDTVFGGDLEGRTRLWAVDEEVAASAIHEQPAQFQIADCALGLTSGQIAAIGVNRSEAIEE